MDYFVSDQQGQVWQIYGSPDFVFNGLVNTYRGYQSLVYIVDSLEQFDRDNDDCLLFYPIGMTYNEFVSHMCRMDTMLYTRNPMMGYPYLWKDSCTRKLWRDCARYKWDPLRVKRVVLGRMMTILRMETHWTPLTLRIYWYIQKREDWDNAYYRW